MISIVVTNGVDIGTVVAIELFASYAVAIVVAANTVSAEYCICCKCCCCKGVLQ